MFKKSKIKIVATIMVIIGALFVGTLVLIYYTSYRDVVKQNTQMLKKYAELYWVNGNPEGHKPNQLEIMDETADTKNSRIYDLSTFYSVEISSDGEILNIDNGLNTEMSDDKLIDLCQTFINLGSESGVIDNWIFLIEKTDEATLVVVMDNTVLSDNMLTLFNYSVLFGIIAIIILFFPSAYIAHRIVKPLEENYHKQKRFISDAGHELKTPIAVIGTNLEMQEREFGETKWIENIKYENKQMGNLVYQLLELAHLDNASPKMSRQNFSRIVNGGTLPFECVAYEMNKKLEVLVDEEIYVLGNEEQLNNLIAILLDNALVYSPKNNTITVTLRENHNMAELLVLNEGEPIPEDQRKELFNRFYRIDLARNRENGHYGLGLSIAKAIVTAHNGKIGVNCRHNLVVFSVLIPINNKKNHIKK